MPWFRDEVLHKTILSFAPKLQKCAASLLCALSDQGTAAWGSRVKVRQGLAGGDSDLGSLALEHRSENVSKGFVRY